MKKKILAILGGGIAAVKSLDYLRGLRKEGYPIQALLTKRAEAFLTPLSVSCLLGQAPLLETHFFDPEQQDDLYHIRLVRETDLILWMPATVNSLVKTSLGLADSLACACFVTTEKSRLCVPSMNPSMWRAAPTQRAVQHLRADGVSVLTPDSGPTACGETGPGRLPPFELVRKEVERLLAAPPLPPSSLGRAGEARRALVTAGPTLEPLDAVRFLSNPSSGKQGYALAEALVACGVQTTLISGPTALEPPAGVHVVPVQTAEQMRQAVRENLPVDVAFFAAAVSDWHEVNRYPGKRKKTGEPLTLTLTETPDILAETARGPHRPPLLVGFAAETDWTVDAILEKKRRKNCDWLVVNAIPASIQEAASASYGFRSDFNCVTLFTSRGQTAHPRASKTVIATWLVARALEALEETGAVPPARSESF